MNLDKKRIDYNKSEETFKYFMSSLKDSISGWDYFVKWKKVYKNLSEVEMSLNLLNYLLGKEKVEEEFKSLLKKYPDIIKAIPILLASRESCFQILKPIDDNEIKFDIEKYDFSNTVDLSENDIDRIVEFTKNTGILDIIKNKKVKNLVDYVLGVEVGLDSNGRKNRSGTSMENLVELFIKDLCNKYNYEYIVQATPNRIKEKWNLNVKVDKASRRFDFAIKTNNKLFLIETNYYSGGGSKLKATAGEYKTLYDLIISDGYEFIWITDGKGWLAASKSLKETFEHNKYLLNLNMIEEGILESILNESISI